MYSKRVRQLVAELPHRGALSRATHSGEATNPICGDSIRLELEVTAEVIEQAGFRGQGCPAALASAAGLTELIYGQPVARARAVTIRELLSHLDGLPEHKLHGAEMAIEALGRALATGSKSGPRKEKSQR